MTDGEFWLAVVTVFAVLVGPIAAVIVTRIIDDRRADQTRKYDIFRTLMRTRMMPIHFEHVGALNLVEVEFIKHPAVIKAWKDYLTNLGETFPPPEEKEKSDAALKKRNSLLTKLISEIAKVLRVNVEQLDILEGNYIPRGWNDDDWEQKLVRRGLINVLHGRAPIVIQPQQANSPYPPPPEIPKAE